jgi:2-polyprenyl-3-methyl-5-hydroxy-6-metoxy-1,4-benzoquinol methylase
MDPKALMDFVGKAVVDVGAALAASMVVIGDRLGFYRALASAGPLSAPELADRTGTAERYVREWLAAQAAVGYLRHVGGDRFQLPDEQAVAFTDETSPACVIGAFQLAVASMQATDRITEAFRSGRGLSWGDHHPDVPLGCARFFRPGYLNFLATQWLPALNGVEAKLRRGARVADVGCGHGASTIVMAKAFPESRFFGFDAHEASVEAARRRAAEEGVAERVEFATATAKTFPGSYDLVTLFDCLHDMGDPAGACVHIRSRLQADGTLMVVEPFAADALDGNLNPVGAVYYAFSTLLCTPSSLSLVVGAALGAQAGEARLREVALGAGFSALRRVAETPFNIVLEARP